MRRSRNSRGTWTRRFLRGRIPDRNPLRRRTDRLETTILAGLLIAVCAAAPFLAGAASGWEHSAALRQLRVQQATSHQVRATVVGDVQHDGGYPFILTEANLRWSAPDGRRIIELLRVPIDTQAGGVIQIWINESGQSITPLLPTQIPGREAYAATGAVTGLAVVALVAGLAAYRTLNRRRMAAWATDWMVTESRWNTRRRHE
jgi:hypothetical protein